MHRRLDAAWLLTVCSITLLLPVRARALDGVEDVRAALRRDGAVGAFVLLRAEAPSTGSSDHRTSTSSATRFRDAQDRCLAHLPAGSSKLRYRYRYSPHLFLEVVREDALDALAELPHALAVALDGRGKGALDTTRPHIGADAVQELGFRGAGRVVAVLDSGVDSDHPDLEAALLHQHHFLSEGVDVGPGAEDGHGHGSNVAGIITSDGIVAPRGVAPDADLVVVKVLDDSNSGWFSDWTAGLEHVVALHESGEFSIDVVNMSLASNALFDDVCDDALAPFSAAADAARELGITLVGASGNRARTGEMSLPACFGAVIAVGSVAIDGEERVSSFTNRNQLLDVLAPGESVVSADRAGGARPITGTSQATPHVAALACLLLEADPALGPDGIIEILRATGVPIFDPATGRTFPRIDALAAVGAVAGPTVEGLACELLSASRTATLTWQLSGSADGLELRVLLDHETLSSRMLDPTRQATEIEVSGPGTYTLELRASSGELVGRPSSCELEVSGGAEPFIRGDCDGNARLEISDPIRLLNSLFVGEGTTTPCRRACDSNDDDELNVTDAIFLLRALFQGDAVLPAPGAACGLDPDIANTRLSCEETPCD